MKKEFDPIVDLPYPSISVEKKDLGLANMIFKAYAGNISEYTGANQYIFQSIYLNNYKELSDLIRTISITEMKHIRMLGELLVELGTIPYTVSYNNSIPIPWNSDFVNFTIDYREMLLSNIDIEKKSIDYYNEIISYTSDENVKRIFERIILDERRHIEIFSRLLDKYDNDK